MSGAKHKTVAVVCDDCQARFKARPVDGVFTCPECGNEWEPAEEPNDGAPPQGNLSLRDYEDLFHGGVPKDHPHAEFGYRTKPGPKGKP